jgi:hypothetical protein
VGRAFSGLPTFEPAFAFQPVRLHGKVKTEAGLKTGCRIKSRPTMAVVGRAFSEQPAFRPASASQLRSTSPATPASQENPAGGITARSDSVVTWGLLEVVHILAGARTARYNGFR